MRRVIALAMLLALALVPPAAQSAKKTTKVRFSGWELRTNGVVKHVKPGGTYAHCPGKHPTRILVRGRMSRPGTKGTAYTVRWMVGHLAIFGYHSTTGSNGKLKGLIHGGGGPLPDGVWKAIALYDGKQVGSTRIAIVSRRAACG